MDIIRSTKYLLRVCLLASSSVTDTKLTLVLLKIKIPDRLVADYAESFRIPYVLSLLLQVESYTS